MSHDDIVNQPPVMKPAEELAKINIEGVRVKGARVLGDDRGILIEVLDAQDPYWELPMTWMYIVTCRPGKAKGWGIHEDHTDRYIIISGEMQLVLYDDRPESPTYKVVQEFYLSDRGIHQITIPSGVWHMHRNLGQDDLKFLNAPSKPFNHKNPDKRRLPIHNDYIPYTIKPLEGW